MQDYIVNRERIIDLASELNELLKQHAPTNDLQFVVQQLSNEFKKTATSIIKKTNNITVILPESTGLIQHEPVTNPASTNSLVDTTSKPDEEEEKTAEVAEKEESVVEIRPEENHFGKAEEHDAITVIPVLDSQIEEKSAPIETTEELIQNEDHSTDNALNEILETAPEIDTKEPEVKKNPIESFNPWESANTDDEIPTMAMKNQETSTIKQALSQNKSETILNETLSKNINNQNANLSPIKDLKSAININDRFLFTKDLFNNDQTAFLHAIKTLDNFKSRAEAQFYWERELEEKLHWSKSSPAYQKFLQFLHRRFS